ncbi:MAG: histidine kinase [Glaciihabitans sp.]|nr:histidine kinase [Glaciihabitans sp.]
MELIAKERDRLLRRTARALGLSGTATTLVGISLPGVVPVSAYLEALPFFVTLVISQIMVGRTLAQRWVALGIISGLAALTLLRFSGDSQDTDVGAALAPLAAAGIASFVLAARPTVAWVVALVAAFATSTFLVQQASESGWALTASALTVVLGWTLATLTGYWISASVPRASRRIYSIGKAHRAERQASELEAQRRQSARLLHDTVLATLTLLAHSGVGVAPAALQQQAGDDARLLRQLRLGATPTPQASGSYTLEPAVEPVLGTTLESVKQRFGRMGLEVNWHGTGQVLLPSEVLDAFLLSLAECLENVRRHSGVRRADVTITDDATTVRAMVTDAGIGFDLAGIDEDKLGFKESVIGRLREVGGNARLFSSPGSGTTVVLEVPK